MSRIFQTKKGNTIVLLNPAEKGKRYARQLKSGMVQETGVVLTPCDKSFRIGYLTSRSDNAKAYKSLHPRMYPRKKKKNSKWFKGKQ